MAIWIHLGRASWTYSCELLRYPTIPSQSWREPLEPGAAPTTPDDWPTAQARSLTRIRLYTSEGLWSWTTERKSWMCTLSHTAYASRCHTVTKDLKSYLTVCLFAGLLSSSSSKSRWDSYTHTDQMFCFTQDFFFFAKCSPPQRLAIFCLLKTKTH